jgi:hypothetical protein
MNNTTQTPFSYALSTDKAPNSDTGLPTWTGFIFLFGSSFFWGSIYLPVKGFEIADAYFFQLMNVAGLWLVGFVVNAMRNFPPFKPEPIIGGILMSFANFFSLYAIRFIGMGMSFILFNATCKSFFLYWCLFVTLI